MKMILDLVMFLLLSMEMIAAVSEPDKYLRDFIVVALYLIAADGLTRRLWDENS